MKTIPLTRGMVAIVDAADYPELSKHKWFAEPTKGGFYAARQGPRPNRRLIRMHRILAGASGGQKVDHKNRNKLDNRRDNLRVCDYLQNNHNIGLSKVNTSGYKGVSWYKPGACWRARIKSNGKSIYLGYFSAKEDAARAYNQAAIQNHGEFAYLNPLP